MTGRRNRWRCRDGGGHRGGGEQTNLVGEGVVEPLRDSDVLADITVAFFQTARSYIEGFALYGQHRGVEWPIDNEGSLTVYDMTGPAEGRRGNLVTAHELDPPDVLDRLPEPLRRFTRPCEVQLPGMPHPARVGAAHGGSHPHLVHEFVSSIIENRPPLVDAPTAARWTAPGICAGPHSPAVSSPKFRPTEPR